MSCIICLSLSLNYRISKKSTFLSVLYLEWRLLFWFQTKTGLFSIHLGCAVYILLGRWLCKSGSRCLEMIASPRKCKKPFLGVFRINYNKNEIKAMKYIFFVNICKGDWFIHLIKSNSMIRDNPRGLKLPLNWTKIEKSTKNG